jgi:putative ABC transport system ATP-binding protein
VPLGRRRNVGIVFHFFHMLPTLTVLVSVAAPLDFRNAYAPREREGQAMALLERFDVADQAQQTPDILPGGQQQRVAVARASKMVCEGDARPSHTL